MDNQVRDEEIFKVVAPLEAILSDGTINAVMIDNYQRVLVEHQYGIIEEVQSPFASPGEYRDMIDALFALYGKTLDEQHPIGYLRFSDNSRAMAVVEPVADGGPYFVLRKPGLGRDMTWDKLLGFGSATQEILDLLRSAVENGVNILVSGGAGSGKTTLLKLVAELIPGEKRIVIAEPVYTIANLSKPRVVRLQAGESGELSFDNVLEAASLMRPDWLVIGELSGPEAMRALSILGQGYTGMTTLHASNVEDALARLESMVMMANVGLGLAEIRRVIASGIGLIVHQQYLPDKKRKIVQIVEMRGVDNNRYILQPLMHFNMDSGQFEWTDAVPGWQQ